MDTISYLDEHTELVRPLNHPDTKNYAGALMKPVQMGTCSKLKNDKWKSCHPDGNPRKSAPTCKLFMNVDTLTDLYNAHMSCHNLRLTENSSVCFSKKDKGHEKAQEKSKDEAQNCLDILYRKQPPTGNKIHDRFLKQYEDSLPRLTKITPRKDQLSNQAQSIQQPNQMQQQNMQQQNMQQLQQQPNQMHQLPIQNMQQQQDESTQEELEDFYETVVPDEPVTPLLELKKKKKKKTSSPIWFFILGGAALIMLLLFYRYVL